MIRAAITVGTFEFSLFKLFARAYNGCGRTEKIYGFSELFLEWPVFVFCG